MNDEKDQSKSATATAGASTQNPSSEAKERTTGDPGRTPGKAEGDVESVEESLKREERG